MKRNLFTLKLIIGSIIVFSFVFLLILEAPVEVSSAPQQEGHTLDLNDYTFSYSLVNFNDSDTTKEFNFNESELDQIYWVTLPQNSTITDAGMELKGKIRTIYKTMISDSGLLEVRVSNVTSDPGSEILSGSSRPAPNVFISRGADGNKLWHWNLEHADNTVYDIKGENLTSNPGNEIAFTVQELNKLVVINANDDGGEFAWEYITPTTGSALGMDVGDLEGDGENEIVFGDSESNIYAMNSSDNSGTQRWNVSLDGQAKSINIINITTEPGKEIVAAADKLYIINSTGDVSWTKDFGTSLDAVYSGEVLDDPVNEIVVGTANPDNKIYLINTTDTGGQVKWDYQLSARPMAVTIGDATSEPAGNEIVVGDNDHYVTTLSAQGEVIWTYNSDEAIESVDVGNITSHPGEEVIAGGMLGNMYTFNFNFFPTNLSVDVGDNGTYEWVAAEDKIRSKELVNTSEFQNGIQSYLDSCDPDSNGNCDVPFRFHSNYQGRLNISNLDIEYDYDVSSLITKEGPLDKWSRTEEIRVNESVGNQTIRINYNDNPATEVLIKYIKINSGAGQCDYGGKSYSVDNNAEGDTVCDVQDFSLLPESSLPPSGLLWNDTLDSSVPVEMNVSEVWYTNSTDNYTWNKNLTIWNETGEIPQKFYNVTANVSINDSVIKEEEFLQVKNWEEEFCDITPDVECGSEPVTYEVKKCSGDNFYACKQDTNGNGVIDFFKWKQNETSGENSLVNYIAGGSTNARPALSNFDVTPELDIWGANFTFNLSVNDTEGNNVSVTLYVYENQTEDWKAIDNTHINGTGYVLFPNVTSDIDWAGENNYKFEYYDYNSNDASQVFHSPINSTESEGPTGNVHNISFVNVTGEGIGVNRTENVILSAYINDSTINESVQGNMSTKLWVMTNDSFWRQEDTYNTTSTNYISYTFTPLENYSVGSRKWKLELFDEEPRYKTTQSRNLSIDIYGRLSVDITDPEENEVIYRDETYDLEARLLDTFDRTVEEDGYNCTFLRNGGQIDQNVTNSSGYCIYSWMPSCSLDRGLYAFNVTLGGNGSVYYTIENDKDSESAFIYGKLDINITEPIERGDYYKNGSIDLNSTVNDTCNRCYDGDYNVSWYLNKHKELVLNLTELSGVERDDEMFVLTGEDLASRYVDLSSWKINNTRIFHNGTQILSEVRPWPNSSKISMNHSQEYMNNFSEVVFPINLDSGEEKSYTVTWNDSDNTTREDYHFIKNGGFESGQLAEWTYNKVEYPIDPTEYSHSIEEKSSDNNSNYSVHLFAESQEGSNIFLNQSIDKKLASGNINIKYKVWGSYGEGKGYVKIWNGTDYRRMSLVHLNKRKESETNWMNLSWEVEDLEMISILVNDQENEDYEEGASHLLIDYICLANSTGSCITPQSGAPVEKEFDTRDNFGTGQNLVRNILENLEPGRRRIRAKVNGANYLSDWQVRDFDLFGRSEITGINITSDYCVYDENGWKCASGQPLQYLCYINDSESGKGVYNYNVSYYNDTSLIDNAYTDFNGVVLVNDTAPTEERSYNITCNITDQPSIYYNATDFNEKNISFEVSSGTTNGTLLRTPEFEDAININGSNNYTFAINFTLLNIGENPMYSPEISINSIEGVFAYDQKCDTVMPDDNCSQSVYINVTQEADVGESLINITANWTNSNGIVWGVSNNTTLNVEPNTEINIVEDKVESEVTAGYEGIIVNFTVESFGNTPLDDIEINISGYNASQINEWTNLSETFIDSLVEGRENSETIEINGSIPIDINSKTTYLANITANATNSTCDPGKCVSTSLFNLTVNIPDWYLEEEPSILNKTIGTGVGNGSIGSIKVINNRNVSQSFEINTNLTVNGNSSDKSSITLSESNFTLNKSNSSDQSNFLWIEVWHNVSEGDYTTGTHSLDIEIENLNDSIPSELTTNATLDVVPLTAEIIHPTSSDREGPLNASENINLATNVTRLDSGGSRVVIDSNVDFTTFVGGELCEETKEPDFNDIENYWYWKCSAPNILGNPINNTIEVTAENEGIRTSGEQENAVSYYDVTRPKFSEVRAEPVRWSANKGKIPIEVDVSDNSKVDEVWMEIETPNGTVEPQLNASYPQGDTYRFELVNTENELGDYDITVYANDTGGFYGYPGHLNSTKGWFDIYKPVNMLGDLKDAGGNNISAYFEFYRSREDTNRSILVHNHSTELSSSIFNWTLHRRNYDMKANIFDHSVVFENLNANSSSLVNGSLRDEIEEPFKFHNYPNTTSTELSILPSYFKYPVLGLVVESDLDFDNATFNLDYKEAMGIADSKYDEFKKQNLEVVYCYNWSFEDENCSSGINNTDYIPVDPSDGGLEFSTNPSTLYIIAQGCYNAEGQLTNCAGLDSSTEPPSGGGGGSAPQEEEEEEEEEKPFPFDIQTNLETSRVFPGDEESYWMMVTNKLDENLTVNVSKLGEIREWVQLEERSFNLSEKESKTFSVRLLTPEEAEAGRYEGRISLEALGRHRMIPWTVEVKERGENALDLSVDLINDRISVQENLTAKVKLKNVGEKGKLDVNLTYLVKDGKNKTVKELKDNLTFESSYNEIKTISFEDGLQPGEHTLVVWAEFEEKAVKDMANFYVTETFWASTAGQALLFLGIPIAIIVLIVGTLVIRKYYREWKEEEEEEKRYLFPVDDSKVPQLGGNNFWVGKIADSNKKAAYSPKDLTTHILVAGATGSGKSVAASVFAEEALDNDVPVVVFDPTAQWTGFVRRCQDQYMLKRYGQLGMDKKKRKSYPGMIYEMDDPNREINFEKLMNPGEITVFTLNNLTPEEFDQAVRNIIDSMFDKNWEESEGLRLVVVFDEVHRLLEKYGGKGGYKALERACREFRKWGIGLIMVSQVLTDFKEAVAGNVLTDVQLNTKAMEDINKAKSKYGEKYAKRVTRQGIGVGMMQHPQYNEGNPWFVKFRPTWHNPHKLNEEELEKYKKFSEELEEIESKIDKMKEEGKETFDMETSIRMAKDKLKSGNFRMAEIYISSLKEKVGD